jgi:GNAT superfamily N-acetyltransferase
MSGHASPVAIRLARPEERDSLEALQWRASLANESDRPHLEANPDAIDLPAEQIANGQVLVAERDGHVVGFSAVLGSELDGLFVEPDLWRSGIGAALVEASRRLAGSVGLTVIANPAALEFYQRCGFALEGETQTRFGQGLLMRASPP